MALWGLWRKGHNTPLILVTPDLQQLSICSYVSWQHPSV